MVPEGQVFSGLAFERGVSSVAFLFGTLIFLRTRHNGGGSFSLKHCTTLCWSQCKSRRRFVEIEITPQA
jgi:hypothetical protein